MPTAQITRSGQTGALPGSEQAHTLIILLHDKLGAIDRVVGLLRRRRANMQTLVLGRAEQEGDIRITVSVDDSQVGVEQLVEQLRKIVDVYRVTNLPAQHAVTRQLALIKIDTTPSTFSEIIERGQRFGAHTVDVTPETMTLEVAGSEESISQLVDQLRDYGIREVARSGCVAIARGNL
jgi:acetolactate synthase-1/3 small subunit